MASMKMFREVLQAVRPLVQEQGGTLTTEQGRKHMFLVVTINGVTKRSPMCCSPRSKDYIIQLKINDIKKMLKEWNQ